ncbi:hydrogenase nickel incorporation protein HypB [Clostridium cellulovorans]|uniref:Hydrogenase accessory protein HypB n=1 Tax=Clostridium cellulovorans (strain ATCC 35296 / DSM 3052 / OCM 3 / 743B) TaxID=573061 RepID=D9SUL0_CLOC7|nr:hydrogenase nickel incorporation protein HypB [Clostridium cellulovorans]ADL50915.1 hydrogenase accessory protein HypB [Clostridium cellulovorans 743B]
MKSININKRILQSNTEFAERNRKFFNEKGIVAVNIFGSPGAGKTSILEKVIKAMKEKISIGVIEGDLYTTKDGERIEGQGIPVVQINTCGACHLDAAMVEKSVETMATLVKRKAIEKRLYEEIKYFKDSAPYEGLKHSKQEKTFSQEEGIANLDILFIENIGNLVCPASYDLGESKRITVLSITEGNDKPLKYPSIFKQSQAVILNKIDILKFTDFDLEEFYKDIYTISKDIKVFLVSARTGEGINELSSYLLQLGNEV